MSSSTTELYIPPHMLVNRVMIVWSQETAARGWDPLHAWKLRIRARVGDNTWVTHIVSLDYIEGEWDVQVQSFDHAKEVARRVATGEWSVRQERTFRDPWEERFPAINLPFGSCICIL